MSNTQVWQNSQDVKIASPNHIDVGRNTSVFGISEKRSTEHTVNIVCCDESTSFEDPTGNGDPRPKIEAEKEALTMFVSGLPATSYLGIISFSSSARIIWPLQVIGGSKLDIIKAIQKLRPHGSTDMKGGLGLAIQEFKKSPSGYILRCYMTTDGIPDSDPTNEAERLKQLNVQLNTIGFGEGVNIALQLLQKMASVSSSGTPLFHHVTDAVKLTSFFKHASRTL